MSVRIREHVWIRSLSRKRVHAFWMDEDGFGHGAFALCGRADVDGEGVTPRNLVIEDKCLMCVKVIGVTGSREGDAVSK